MNPILKVSNLHIHFGGIIALYQAQFNVAPHSITAIIGPNGAGKTTLFNCITGFYRAHSGTLNYMKNTKEYVNLLDLIQPAFSLELLKNPKKMKKTLYYKMLGGSHLINRIGIARTFQNVRLFKKMTTLENLLVAQHTSAPKNFFSSLLKTKTFQRWEKKAIEFSYQWLDTFNLTSEANQLAGSLPYGKQRHLEIARAMCTRPQLLCLDEPAAGLNPKETSALSEKLIQLNQQHKITILLIEHDMSMVMPISHWIVALDHGRVIAQGDVKTIQNHPKVIEAYLGIPTEKRE